MASPKDRAAASARLLLFLAGVDGLVFLTAVTANLWPLLPLGGPVPMILAITGGMLGFAAGCGFVAAVLVGRPHPRRGLAMALSLANALLIAGVAVYFASVFRLFAIWGTLFVLLAAPALLSAWLVLRVAGNGPSRGFARL